MFSDRGAKMLTPMLLLLLAAACDKPEPLESPSPQDSPTHSDSASSGWCAVKAVFAMRCLSCHSGPAGLGSLDLSTDPHGALVGKESALYPGRTLVVPGDWGRSFLYIKVIGGQSGAEGDPMPLTDGLPPAQSDLIRAWIDAGASELCETAPGDSGRDTEDSQDSQPPGPYHPEGYASAEVHGLEAKLQVQSCTSCHGADLSGVGEIASYDSCHTAGWRTDCTYCHGGKDNSGGAPPQDINGEAVNLSFLAHTAHVSDTDLHLAYDCETCHVRPSDALSLGHVFVDDATPAEAELDFTAGLSPAASWDGEGTCASSYCHGDGQGDNGEVEMHETLDCGSCHPHQSSGATGWATMSGSHSLHMSLGNDFDCGDCHKSVVKMWEPIEDPSLHLDGQITVTPVGTMTWYADAGSCDGECHSEPHTMRSWY